MEERIFLVEVVLVVINPLQIVNVPEAIAGTKDFGGNQSFPTKPEPVFSDVDVRRPIFPGGPVDGLADAPRAHLPSLHIKSNLASKLMPSISVCNLEIHESRLVHRSNFR